MEGSIRNSAHHIISYSQHRVVDEGNRLSNHIGSAEMMRSFKRRLHKFMDEDDRWNETVVLHGGQMDLTSSCSFHHFLMFLCR